MSCSGFTMSCISHGHPYINPSGFKHVHFFIWTSFLKACKVSKYSRLIIYVYIFQSFIFTADSLLHLTVASTSLSWNSTFVTPRSPTHFTSFYPSSQHEATGIISIMKEKNKIEFYNRKKIRNQCKKKCKSSSGEKPLLVGLWNMMIAETSSVRCCAATLIARVRIIFIGLVTLQNIKKMLDCSSRSH